MLTTETTDFAGTLGEGAVLTDACSQASSASSPEWLRRVGWEIGEERAAEAFTPAENHVGLAMVGPVQAFAHWRLLQGWVEDLGRRRGGAWHGSRMILRLYDVSYLEFNGWNAHHIQDHNLHGLCGDILFRLPRPGTWQLAETGFLLRSGEFVPAARSQAVSFARDSASPQNSGKGLLVEGRGRLTDIDNIWDQERILQERRRPRERQQLRIAAFAFAEEEGRLPAFMAQLAEGQANHGHEVHLFFAHQNGEAAAPPADNGVHFHALELTGAATPLETAQAFARAAHEHLDRLAPFDLLHLHEWMTGLVARPHLPPAILSLSSIEEVRRNGTPVNTLSAAIARQERQAAETAALVLTPPPLRDRVIAQLGAAEARVRSFPMEGRMPNEWELPLDPGAVKMEVGFGPLDRMLLFVGPLEHAAGVDVLLDAMPVLLQRWSNVRLACVGAGDAFENLRRQAHHLGVAFAVRLLGHVEGERVTRLLRSSVGLVLPSRYRVPFDDAVVDLARRAGRPVVTTHSGPAHLVRHEETGLITYDNPGSMVWAIDRLLGDPAHADYMGNTGRRHTGSDLAWSEVARHYLKLCAEVFPELTTHP